MQPPLPAPSASGSFVKTPFVHLLVYALERRLTGTFELSHGGAPAATVLVVNGLPAKVRTSEPAHYLGTVMTELGMITPEHLESSLARMQESARLQGQILLEMGAADQAQLDAGLRSQVERKIEHLFRLPTDTAFAYYDGHDLLQHFGGAPTPIDPFPVLWRGVRESPASEHVDVTLRRIGGALLRISAKAELERFAFTPEDLQAIDLIRQRPTRLVDVTSVIGPELGRVLVYFLTIMKQVDLLDANARPPAAARPAESPATLVQGAPIPPPPSSGQAFARVQLQRQPTRTPLVVEEHVSGAYDERASTPGVNVASAFGKRQLPSSAFGPPIGAFAPANPPAPADPVGSADIGAMISKTISSLPPVAHVAPPSVPAPASVPSGAEPSGLAHLLTAEQNTLKAKILERADKISSQDYFQMLGLPRDATSDQVQTAFFGLAKVWHPDRLPPALIDVKDACTKVFSHLTEAHSTLMDESKRQEYMMLLKEGGATPADQAKIQAILEAATEFQKAEILLKRNPSDPQAYEIVKRCVSLDSGQADYLATLAWLDAQKPEWLSREKTFEKISVLDRCIQMTPNCARAYFYRGMLYKRSDEPNKALKDFKKAAELNPRNLDAMREVRLHHMRGLGSKPPPGSGPKSKPPPAETLGGLFGKLFKK